MQLVAAALMAIALIAFIIAMSVSGRRARKHDLATMTPDQLAQQDRDDASWSQRYGF